MMIGAGVFLGIGNSIAQAGPGGTILTFALNTVLAMCTAMSYAELSSAIPRAGGAYNFARTGFGRGPSFIAGWMEWFASSVAGSMYAITFAIYSVRYLNRLGWLDWLLLFESVAANPEVFFLYFEKLVAVLIVLSFLYVNYRGVSETGMVGAIMTLGQTLFLVFIGVAGIVVAIRDPFRLTNFTPFLPFGWNKLLITMGFTYVAFEGFEVISQAGDEAISPRKNLPKAMLYLTPRFPISTIIRHCRNIDRGIMSAIRERKIDLLILGWHGNKQDQRFTLGSTLDYILSRSPCDILILKDCGNKKFSNTLVPLFKSTDDEFALEIADLLTERGGRITLLPLYHKRSPLSDKYINGLTRKISGREIVIEYPGSTDRLQVVLKSQAERDLLVLGLKQAALFYNTGVSSFQEEIAYYWQRPLTLVRRARGLGDFTKRWF